MSSTKTTLRISASQKEKSNKVPKGAKILNKEVDTEVEEIENGFLLIKRYDIRYQIGKGEKASTEYAYFTKKWFHEENPIQISIDSDAPELADLI